MFRTLLTGALSAPDSPTADLYFFNACGDLLEAGVSRLAPTVVASDQTCVVMRHDSGLPALPRRQRLVYLIDDEVDDGVTDSSLPFLYRQKLRLLERPARRRIARKADLVVVSSPALQAPAGRGLRTRLLHPYWSEPIADLRHFDTLLGDEGWAEIVYLGSSVHRADLEFLLPVIGAVLEAWPRARFHLAERHRLPAPLAEHPRVLRIPGRGWGAYRRGLAERRFHLALYPLMDTPFNRARSVNKLIEHGVVGAAGLYSRSWGEAWRAGTSSAGLVLRNQAEDWYEAISHLLAHPQVIRGLAAGGAKLARQLNRRDAQRDLWLELLGMEADIAA